MPKELSSYNCNILVIILAFGRWFFFSRIYHRTIFIYFTRTFSIFTFIIAHFPPFRRWFFLFLCLSLYISHFSDEDFFFFCIYHRKNVGVWTRIFLISTFIIVHNPFLKRGFLRFLHLSSSKYLIPYSYYFHILTILLFFNYKGPSPLLAPLTTIPTILLFSHSKAYTHTPFA